MRTRYLLTYVGRRLLLLIPLALGVTIAVFLLQSLIPGGPVAAILQGHAADAATVEALQRKFNLDKPLWERYLLWLGAAVHGDLGTSLFTSQSVNAAITSRIGVTLVLNLVGMALCLLVGIPMGVAAAYHRGGWIDRAAVALNVVISSAPPFIIAILLLFVFGYAFGWFPLYGLGIGGPGDLAWHLVLPCIIMGIGPLGFITRLTRASLLENLDADYVTFARARGVGFWRILRAYALRNSLLPIITGIGLLLIGLLTGTVFVETVFGLPGLGSLLVTSVTNSDFPVIQGLVLIIAAWIIAANLVIDIAYAFVDPRVSFGKVAR